MRMKSGTRWVYIAAIGRIWSDLSREEYWLELQLSVSVCLSQAVQEGSFLGFAMITKWVIDG
jgi:hypothetical protein